MSIHVVSVVFLPDGRADPENAARYLGLKRDTLRVWRRLKKGPPFVRVGGRIWYRRADLDAFVAAGDSKRAA